MLLQLNDISKSFGNSLTRNLRKVLDGITLEMQAGGSIAILGPSGSGKTTLLNIIGSIEQPDSGSVIFEKENITTFPEQKMNVFRNTKIGFIFQFHHLLPQLTLQENILLPTLSITKKVDKDQRYEYANSLMKRVGVWEQRDQKPGQLSGGECQRTAVIRAMINSPSLLLADEPTGALDEENAGNLADLLLELNKTDKVALIVVTHSISLAERMDSIYRLKNGRLS